MPHAPAGAVQNKVIDAETAGKMAFYAALGHACGLNFKASSHLAKFSAFSWQKGVLRDMNARPWTEFSAK